MGGRREHVSQILTPELCLAVYQLKYPFGKGQLPSGAVVGWSHFRPCYMQALYDLIYHETLVPMSKIPLESLLAIDFTELLPSTDATDYPEQCLGMITVLDRTRLLTSGYSFRYTRDFFDHICEKLARQLISLPSEMRPHDRQHLKDYLHAVRSEMEAHLGKPDPFAALEAADDVDVTAFQEIEAEGPPQKSYSDSDSEATVSDYAFWWIRILNSHFAITDMCGHYPYWVRSKGFRWKEADKEFMKKTDNYRYDPASETVLQEIRNDLLEGVWRPLEPYPKYEKHQQKLGGVVESEGQELARSRLTDGGNIAPMKPTGSSKMPP